jgi:succinate dehydrogenase hydrophobic anchor subunit
MPVLQLLVILIVAGVGLWLVNKYIPMDRKIKSILNAVVVVIIVIWLLGVFGVFDSLSTLRIGK